MNNKATNKIIIYYTGIGAKKSGKHTKKEFLKLAKKEFGEACSIWIANEKCKPCKKSKKFEMMAIDEEINALKEGKKYKISKKGKRNLAKLRKKCKKCLKKTKKKCNLKQYLDYSGAEV